MHLRKKLIIWSIPFYVIVVTMACGLPGGIQSTIQVPPTPSSVASPRDILEAAPTLATLATPTPLPLPPTLVEVDPPLGSDFPLQGPLTLHFNQEMDRPSVEIAISGEPTLSGRFRWADDDTVIFEPDTPLLPGSDLQINISTSALASNGLFLMEPIHLNYRVVPLLKVLHVMPEPGLQDVDPASAIAAIFSQPVVPVGVDPESQPAAFEIRPAVPGKGMWTNTSTYIFYPDPALAGGIEYTVLLNPDLKSAAGGPLMGLEPYQVRPYEWTFETASPRLVSIKPATGADSIRLDTAFRVEFSQPMDIASVEANFNLYETNQQSIPGVFGWDKGQTTLTFTPTQQLVRGTYYDLVLLGTSQASGGALLGNDYVARVKTVPDLRVTGTEPVMGGVKSQYANLALHFNGPTQAESPLDYFSFTPTVTDLSHWWDESGRSLYLDGDFEPLTAYTVTVSGAFPDPWGGTLGEDFTFRFSTDALEPNFFVSSGESALFTLPEEAAITVQATHIEKIGVRLGSVSFEELVQFLAPGGHDDFHNFKPDDLRNWTYTANLDGAQNHMLSLPITRGEMAVDPGIYHLSFYIPELGQQPSPYLLVSSNVQLSFKMSTTNAFVWAVDLRNQQPVAGVPVAIYDSYGNRLTSGATDSLGVFQSPITTQPDLYNTHYALMGDPGSEFFSISLSTWSQGIDGYDFGFDTDFTAPDLMTYLYTDRSIYRPGQTVYFRGVLRHEHNGRYALAEVTSLPVTVFDENDNLIWSHEMPLSSFGTLHGEVPVPVEAQSGRYRIHTAYGAVDFQVAEYQPADIEVTIETQPAILAGESIQARIEARYLFGSPAGGLPLTWHLYRHPMAFSLPGYQVGATSLAWMQIPWHSYTNPLGELVSSGSTVTSEEGDLTIRVASDKQADQAYTYTLEVILTDESGLPVGARSEVLVHPSQIYLGVHPDSWVGRAGVEAGFEVRGVNWDSKPAGELTLKAQFQKVTWLWQESQDPFGNPTIVPQIDIVASADFRTAPDGVARLAFTPPEAGTYQLEVNGENGAGTQILVWVGGDGQVVWPKLPNNRLQITADKDRYQPGENARIFIPNPLGEGTQALVTLERDEILRYEVLVLDGNGYEYSLPLSDQDAPNIYVSVTLIGRGEDGKPDFRQGYLNLVVEPVMQELQANLWVEPEQLEPGGEAIIRLQMLDPSGNPVQGEFSVAIVDQKVRGLAEPNAEDILTAFYGPQPLGVRTGMSLVVYAHRLANLPAGKGGGGEPTPTTLIRQDFRETAFWTATLVTDEKGEAIIRLQLPENLTSWDVDVRGVTVETRVGEAREVIVATKDLLVRPVVPQFLVIGDHTELAAVIHNNTGEDLSLDVSLSVRGFALDNPDAISQKHIVPTGGRLRVAWPGVVEDVEALELVFSAAGGGYQDTTQPSQGRIPVLRFAFLQTYGTSGVLDLVGERLEVVSLPRTFDATGGTLQVEISPSLAAAMTAGLDALEANPYPGSEQDLSRFLPNLMAYRAIQDLGLESQDLLSRLERTLDVGIQALEVMQNSDGGWGWWPGETDDGKSNGVGGTSSNIYLTSYVVYGLSQARDAGVFVDESMLQRGVGFLEATRPVLQMLSSTWQLDQLAFHYYAIARAGAGTAGAGRNLFEVRDQLSPFATAFLALTLAAYDREDERVGTLLSDLEGSAIQNDTGIYWEGAGDRVNLDTLIFNTAVAVNALAQLDPASMMLPEAVRYLVNHRKADGTWGSSYETAWTLMALTQVMKGTGELAGDFGFTVTLNGSPLLTGQAGEQTRLNPVNAVVPIQNLYLQDPNGLLISRTGGPGRLYYAAYLQVMRPVGDIPPLNQGLSVRRQYEMPDGQPKAGRIGSLVRVRLTLTLDNEAYFLALEDYIPAGAQILNTSLETSQMGTESVDKGHPFDDGWGWWYFNSPRVAVDHVIWTADYLPAGTYELVYTLVLVHPGEYQVLPARAWEFYFPAVQGSSAGDRFVIED